VKLDASWKPKVIPKTDEQVAEISTVISKNILFIGMDAEQRRIIIDAMEEKLFAPEDVIIKQVCVALARCGLQGCAWRSSVAQHR
jgi:hypothetical protein